MVIAGAGLIGLACALECQRLGMRVTVLEKGSAVQEASWAAAGMLAAHDPANPAALTPLAELSLALYPEFLQRIALLSGQLVPMETEWTLEHAAGERTDTAPKGFHADGFRRIAEQSLDPRKLSAALLAAVRRADITLLEGTPLLSHQASSNGVEIATAAGTLHGRWFVDCTGAWSAPVRPAKGQMLRVHAPGVLAAGPLGNVVVRTEEIYLVPRLDGSVVLGATVEDAGYDKTLHEADLQLLRSRAARLIPALAAAPELERWAGLRPGTADHLPVLGFTGERTLIAAGHFRNGVLLAPATASVVGKMLCGEALPVDLDIFAPTRFDAQQLQQR